MSDFKLDQRQTEKLIRTINDLKVQAMMFDMDIDIETLELVPKAIDNTPEWLRRWRDQLWAGDRRPDDYRG